MTLEERIEEKLRHYGLLNVKGISYNGRYIYVANLIPLPFIPQNMITIIIDKEVFNVSSGTIFDSKDTNKEVVHEAEKIMNHVAGEMGLIVRKAADIFWVEGGGDKLVELEKTIEKVAEAIRELNQWFSQNEHLREELLHKTPLGLQRLIFPNSHQTLGSA